MFRLIDELAEGSEPASALRLKFTFDDQPFTGRTGDTVAAALLSSGVSVCRETPVSGAPRGPYCLMGVCFDCLVVIDGVENRQSCLTPLVEGICVRTQPGCHPVERCGK